MVGKGRPVGSVVRQNIIEIIFHLKQAHGYEIYKHYKVLFPRISLRLIYYHLQKGVALEEFVVEKRAPEKGEYSWGESVTKTYYKLGPRAKPLMIKEVQEYFTKKE
ncbi:MAG: hypothetical protein H6502_04070 [Candidatus Woesearchaeota archaeon]|nr:MAG: hypothetical protein H6502_04070 [Candidatus Woesearchaeota archaeon]